MNKQITNYEEITAELPIEQFKNKPNFIEFIKALSMHANDIEDAMFRLKLTRRIDTAVGLELDVIGVIVGAEREGLDDEEFRDDIRFYIALNTSGGEPEILMGALALFSKSKVSSIQEYFPASVIGYIDDIKKITPSLNVKMQKICAGGVKWMGTIIGEDPFGWSIIGEDGLRIDDPKVKGFAIIDEHGVKTEEGAGKWSFLI